MREIKFRAWDDGKMDYNPTFGECSFGGSYVNSFEPSEYEKRTFMQFTGLHDKNGKEIYEGDVVKTPKYGNSQVVEYADINASDDMTAPGMGFQFNDYPSNMEIIGNIYENPELLETK